MNWLLKLLLPLVWNFIWKRIRPLVVKLLKWLMRRFQ